MKNLEVLMAIFTCLKCGYSTPEGKTCPQCGQEVFQMTGAAGMSNGKLPQEILDWARGQVNEEETLAGLREIRETGGLELKDLIQDLEKEALGRE
jgi:hypothetical protein